MEEPVLCCDVEIERLEDGDFVDDFELMPRIYSGSEMAFLRIGEASN